MFEQITTLAIFHFFVIFSRIGTALMVFPGFGEIYVSARARLVTALMISFVMVPVLEPTLPALPGGVLPMFLVILPEIMVGLFIGGITRMLQAILHIAGMIVAFQSSLASALLFDANQGSQGSGIGNFMTLIGLTLLFVTDLHHLMLIAVADSYVLFPSGGFPPVSDMAEMASRTLSGGFLVAVKMSAPLIVTGLLLYLGAGILGRLMPNMQVFFVLIPLQAYVSFIILGLMLSAGMMWYIEHFEEVIQTFLVR